MKLTGSKRIAGGIAIAGALAVTGIVGFAQDKTTQDDSGKARVERHGGRGAGHGEGRGDGRGRGMRGGFLGGRFAEKLNLTDAQKEQMKQIATRFHDGTKALREGSRGQRRKGFDLLNGGTFNEAAVRAAAQERANKQVEMQVARAKMMSEMYAILTAEQKAQLAADHQQREQKRQEWRSRRGTKDVQTQ